MKLKLLIISILILCAFSCRKETQKSIPNPTEPEKISLLDTLTLKLNNGEKWAANLETHIGVTQMDSIIKTFKSGSQKDFAVLGNALSQQTGMIIKKCNMKGEPHEQLHLVLLPMLDEISALTELGTETPSEKVLQELENLIAVYFKHFKTQ